MIDSPLVLTGLIAGATALAFILDRRVPWLSKVGASLLALVFGLSTPRRPFALLKHFSSHPCHGQGRFFQVFIQVFKFQKVGNLIETDADAQTG